MSIFTSNLNAGFKRLFSAPQTIIFHGRVSLEESPTQFFEEFNRCISKLDKDVPGEVTVDLSDAEFIYPSALIFLLAVSDTLGSKIKISISVKNKGPIHEYLISSGFSNYFTVPNLPESFRHSFKHGEVLKLETGATIDNESEKASWFIDRLDMGSKFHESFISTSIDSMEEIFRNVKQHSGYDNWYGLGQVYPTSGKVRVVIYDNGQGIKKSISKSSYSKKHKVFRSIVGAIEYNGLRKKPANHSIRLAAKQLVSSTNYELNSGAGLDFLIKDFGKAFDATITIISGDGMVSWQNGEIIKDIELPFEIKGTMVSISAKGLNKGTNNND